MTNKYLLPCDCGQSVTVGTSQAGQVVKCACGRQLTVPSLRAIRQLTAAIDPSLARRNTSSWNPVKGAMFAIGAILILGGGVTVAHSYSVYSQIVGIRPSDEELEAALEHIEHSPVDEIYASWQLLKEHPLEPAGSSPFAIVREVAQQKLAACYGGLIAIGIGLLLAAVAPIVLRGK